MQAIAREHNVFPTLCRNLLAEGHPVRFTARGTSMFPFICDGDLLTVVPAGANDLRVGDVVLYERPDGRLVAHSLVVKERRGHTTMLTTRAEGLPGADDRFASDAVLGKVVSVRTGRRSVSLDHRTWPLACLLILGPERLSRGAGPLLRGLVRLVKTLPGLLGRPFRRAT